MLENVQCVIVYCTCNKLFVPDKNGTIRRDCVTAVDNVSDNNTSQNIMTEEIYIKSEHAGISDYEEDEPDSTTDKDTG